MSEREQKLRELIAKWRKREAPDYIASLIEAARTQCADELEALLAEPQPAPPSLSVEQIRELVEKCRVRTVENGATREMERGNEKEINALLNALLGAAKPSLSADWPECEEFYNLMQAYRHEPWGHVVMVKQNYEAVKSWLRDRLHTRDKCT